MSGSNSGGVDAGNIGFELLPPSDEGRTADRYPMLTPAGVRIHLTSRQLQIMAIPPAEKYRVPFQELEDLGRLLHSGMKGQADTYLQHLKQNPASAPTFVEEPYKYEPLLTPTSIRLVRLLPDDTNGMMQFSLEIFDLNEHTPRFCALSYTWGNPHAKSTSFNFYDEHADDYDSNSRYPVACNGRLLHLAPNLYDALQQLPENPGIYLRESFGDALMNDLQSAAAQADADLVKRSLSMGSSVKSRDTQGRTALSIAAGLGNVEITRILLEAGSDPQCPDWNGVTPLDQALQNDHQEVVDLILNFGTNTTKSPEPRPRRSGFGVFIWIDAICIDQKNDSERSAQVRVMHRIFAQASYVTMWLGREDKFSAMAVETLMKIFPAASSGALENSNVIPYLDKDPRVYEEAGMPYISMEEWVSLAALYLRQNFRRLWILQESVLPRNVLAFLGPYEIPWDEFLFVTEKLVMQQRRLSQPASMMFQPFYSFPIEDGVHLVSELRLRKQLDEASEERRQGWFSSTRRFWRGDGKRSQIPLQQLMTETATFLCTDPRDHVYALLGICEGHPESPTIDPDYSKPVERLFAETTRLMIHYLENTPSLRIVAAVRDSRAKDIRSLPSWVPDFGQIGVSSLWNGDYAADGEAECEEEISEGPWNQLQIRGIKFDTVTAVAAPRLSGKERVSMLDFDPSWFALALGLPDPYPTGQPRTEALWRTLCADRSAEPNEEEGAPAKYANQFRDQVCAMLLAVGEKSALEDKNMNNQRGVLFPAMMAIAQRGSEGHSGSYVVSAPPGDPRDESLSGPRYRHAPIQAALKDLDELAKDKPSFTPTREDIEAYLENPKYRVWWHTPGLAADTQVADRLPPGEDGFRSIFTTIYGGRRLYRTQRGYLGLGPASLEVGDEVWVIAGSRVPFILRNKRDQTQGSTATVVGTLDELKASEVEIVSNEAIGKGKARAPVDAEMEMSKEELVCEYLGDTYVHGIMHGEAFSLVEEDFDTLFLE